MMELNDLIVENIKEMKGDIKDIKAKVDDLFAFKWKVIGMAMVFSFLMSIMGSFLFKKLFISDSKAKSISKELVNENDKVRH